MSHKTKKVDYRKLTPIDEGYRPCIVEGCASHGYYHKQYCSRHYTQLRLYSKLFESRFDRNRVVYYDNYAEIILLNSKGKEVGRTKVSTYRVPELLNYKWSLKQGKYAQARDPQRKENIIMGRLFLGVLDDSTLKVGYKNSDTLDNRDNNLVIINRHQIAQRAKTPKTNTSGVKGVSLDRKRGLWRAYLTTYGKWRYLGVYYNISEASKARQYAENKYCEVIY